MTGTEWAIGAFSKSSELERRQLLEEVTDQAFGKALTPALAVVQVRDAQNGQEEAQPAPGVAIGPGVDQEGGSS